MKKIILMLLGIILLTGCSTKTDNLKSFKDANSKHETYELKGNMKIISNEDEFTYKITVGVKDNEYFKVSLINTINDHEQIILRNAEGVYVVTPSLNKSFKFMSEWPNNSSQAYLIGNLVSDVSKNSKANIESISNGYQITTTVNYPNNPKLVSEVIKTDKDFNLRSVDIMDEENNVLMNVEFKDINYKPNFARDYFDLSVTDESEESKKESENVDACKRECKDDEECKNSCTTKSTSNILEDIIYPLYVPVDTYLSSKDTIETKDGNRVILTFAGVDPFILVEEVANFSKEMEVIPVSGEPLQIGGAIGALSDNSLYFTSNGVDYYLTSNTLEASEMKLIAESITNGTNLVAGVK